MTRGGPTPPTASGGGDTDNVGGDGGGGRRGGGWAAASRARLNTRGRPARSALARALPVLLFVQTPSVGPPLALAAATDCLTPRVLDAPNGATTRCISYGGQGVWWADLGGDSAQCSPGPSAPPTVRGMSATPAAADRRAPRRRVGSRQPGSQLCRAYGGMAVSHWNAPGGGGAGAQRARNAAVLHVWPSPPPIRHLRIQYGIAYRPAWHAPAALRRSDLECFPPPAPPLLTPPSPFHRSPALIG